MTKKLNVSVRGLDRFPSGVHLYDACEDRRGCSITERVMDGNGGQAFDVLTVCTQTYVPCSLDGSEPDFLDKNPKVVRQRGSLGRGRTRLLVFFIYLQVAQKFFSRVHRLLVLLSLASYCELCFKT